MTIYKVEYNDSCRCHPEYRTLGYYSTYELALKGIKESKIKGCEIDEVEVIDE